MTTVTEADVEQAAYDWPHALGWQAILGPDRVITDPWPTWCQVERNGEPVSPLRRKLGID